VQLGDGRSIVKEHLKDRAPEQSLSVASIGQIHCCYSYVVMLSVASCLSFMK